MPRESLEMQQVGESPIRALSIKTARILIVDDQEANVRLLNRLLARAKYSEIHTSTDSREAYRLVEQLDPDLILLDLQMPHVSGLEVLEELRRLIPSSTYLPVLVLTGDMTPEARNSALALGAKDFLTKPFDASEVLLRVKNLLETRRLHSRLRQEKELLEERVRERTRDLEETQWEILQRLAQAAEFRDDDTGHHTHRVGMVSAMIADALGFSAMEVELIRRAAPLHDAGKIGIPDAILLKPGRLTAEEFVIMKTHTTIGAKLLSGGRSEAVRLAERIALAHHERWDGAGYPNGLKGEEIPLPARIVALADFYDALSHDRPYRNAWPAEDVLAEIHLQTGLHFDPGVVAAFLKVRKFITYQSISSD